MREDYEEQLHKMFPKGYVITYIQPNNDPAYHWFNPTRDEFIFGYLDMLSELFGGEVDE